MSIRIVFLVLSIVSISESYALIRDNKCIYSERSIINEYPTQTCTGITADHDDKILYSWINRLSIVESNFPVIRRNFTEKFPRLIFFHAKNSNVTQIENFAFQNMQSLHRVEIIFNNLTSVPSHLFWNSPKMASFNLTGNPHLIMPNNRPFLSAPQLRWLDLRLTNIKNITRNNFKNVYSLTFLSLAGNLIEYLPDGAFHPLKYLKLLDLAGNKLKTLSLKVFPPTNITTALYLGGNPWRCDCDMYTVIKCLIGYVKDDVRCEEPHIKKWEDLVETDCCNDFLNVNQ